MNKKFNIEEYNTLCAEFLDKVYKNGRIIINYNFPSRQNPTGACWTKCEYHSDWNWIHEVIEKIKTLDVKDKKYASDYNVIIDSFGCYIETTGYHSSTIVRIENQNSKEAVVQAIYQFLIWIKDNK